MVNGTVAFIAPQNNASYFITTDADGQQCLSKNVILATGMKDILPNTPGLEAAWGHDIYWCPWCDGWEHKDAPFANMGAFNAKFIQNTITATTLNPNPVMLTNGTYNDTAVAAALPNWAEELALYKISIENRQIASFGRLKEKGSDYNGDLIITFADNATLIRNTIKANLPAELASNLLSQLGLDLTDDAEAKVNVDARMESSIPGVFVVGDANSDSSSNVPHAMWSAKRAVVYMHRELAKGYTDALAGSSRHTKRVVESQESFKEMKRELKQALAEEISAEELLEYMVINREPSVYQRDLIFDKLPYTSYPGSLEV